MNQRYNNGPPDPGDIFEQMMRDLRRNSAKLGPIILLVAGAILFLTASFQVEPGEVAVIRTLGKETSRVEPGFHFLIPGIQQADKVNMAMVRRIEVGFRGDQARPEEALMLTGDENIVDARMIVQYRVVDPSKFLFRLAAPEATLHATAEVALRSIVGRTTIDDVLTKGRGDVQNKTRELLQRLMETYQSGLIVTEVKLQDVSPPEAVREAFFEVNRAREKKEQLINQAKAYREDIIPRARGNVKKELRAAEAYKEQRVLRAQGDAEKFNAVYREYEKAKGVTRKRMYLETMSNVLSNVEDKTVVDANLPGNTLPVLPLSRQAVGAGAIATPPPSGAAQ